VSDAKEMLQLAQNAFNESKGVALYNGKFIGPPMILNARKILNRNELILRKKK